MVPHGEQAFGRRSGEIGTQPMLLHRTGTDRDVAVERNDVPGAHVVAVVASTRWARERAEIAEVVGRAGDVVIVIARRGTRPRLVPAPRRLVVTRELRGSAVSVHVVTEREHRARDVIE